MSDPASAAGGAVAWKLGAGLLGAGVVASALGFMVLWPKTAREALGRAIATMAGSMLLGPLFVVAAYLKYPGLFTAASKLAVDLEIEPILGQLAVAAPMFALAGLPFWWIVGAIVLWFDRRRGKDVAELVNDARADVSKVVAP